MASNPIKCLNCQSAQWVRTEWLSVSQSAYMDTEYETLEVVHNGADDVDYGDWYCQTCETVGNVEQRLALSDLVLEI